MHCCSWFYWYDTEAGDQQRALESQWTIQSSPRLATNYQLHWSSIWGHPNNHQAEKLWWHNIDQKGVKTIQFFWVVGSDMLSVVFSSAYWLVSWWSLYRPWALCVSAFFVTGYPINRVRDCSNILLLSAFVLGGLHFVVFSSSHQCTFHSSWVISLIAQGQGKLAKLAIGIFWLDLHFGFAIGSFDSQYNSFKLGALNKVSLLQCKTKTVQVEGT